LRDIINSFGVPQIGSIICDGSIDLEIKSIQYRHESKIIDFDFDLL
jgi:hypothetical protein